MDRYHYGSGIVASELPLPELFLVDETARQYVDVRCYLRSRQNLDCGSEYIDRHPHAFPVGPSPISAGEAPTVVRFSSTADFVVARDGCSIDIWPMPDAEEPLLRHLLLDQVLPRVLSQQGQLVLHGSMTIIDGCTICFLAPSGSGKSTLIASLRNVGYPLIGDDGLVVTIGRNGVHATPTYTSLRLWSDSVAALRLDRPGLRESRRAFSKQRLSLPDENWLTRQPNPLKAIYVLRSQQTAGVSISRLSGRDACIAILRNSFSIDAKDTKGLNQRLASATRVVEVLPSFELCYPLDYATLPEVHSVISQHVASLAGLSAHPNV